jgi:hypothetical protein
LERYEFARVRALGAKNGSTSPERIVLDVAQYEDQFVHAQASPSVGLLVKIVLNF